MSSVCNEGDVVDAAIILRELAEAQSALATAEEELEQVCADRDRCRKRAEILRRALQELEAVS